MACPAIPSAKRLRKNTKTFLIAVGLKLSEVSWVYMLTVFVVVTPPANSVCPSR